MTHQSSSPAPLIPERSARRREKRQSLSHVVENPLPLLQLAVEADGRFFTEDSLETGRFHYSDEKFASVVQQLSRPMLEAPSEPLTQILLSGLLQQENKTGVDLINHVRLLRSQVQKRQKRSDQYMKLRYAALAVLITIFISSHANENIYILVRNLQALGYMGHAQRPNSMQRQLRPCHDVAPEDQAHCHARDARVWSTIRDYPLLLTPNIICRKEFCPSKPEITALISQIPGRAHEMQYHAPYALHTIVTNGIRKQRKIYNNKEEDTVRWLGDSRLMQLIRPHVGKKQRILDIGCGVGSLLYALSPRPRNYTGLEISPAAIHIGMRLAQYHDFGRLHLRAELKQQKLTSFFQYSPHHRFDVIVAVESLSYETSIDMELIIQKLAGQLKPGGKLIVVDDVLSPHTNTQIPPGRQLLNHSTWTSLFDQNALQMDHQRDLGLEFTLPQLEAPAPQRSNVELLQSCFSYLQPLVRNSFPMVHTMLKLFQNVVELHYTDQQRALQHQKGELLYVMYVGTKTTQNKITGGGSRQQEKATRQQVAQEEYYAESCNSCQRQQQQQQCIPQQQCQG
jgi:SAM-dependent methyltransferase